MWYFRVLVRAFSTLLLSVILFTILGRNQYAYEHAAIFLTFPAGALAGAWYINRCRRFPRLFRSRRFLIALLIPVAAAFISIYVGVFVSVADMTFGAEGTRGVLSSRYIGLPALVSRF